MNTQSLLQNIHLSLNGSILWVILFLTLLVFIISAVVYSYHWRNYGTNDRLMRTVQSIYIAVGAILLALAALLIIFR